MNRRSVFGVLFGLLLTPWRVLAGANTAGIGYVTLTEKGGYLWTKTSGELHKWEGGTLTTWDTPFVLRPVISHDQPEPKRIRWIVDNLPPSRIKPNEPGFSKVWNVGAKFPEAAYKYP